MNINPINYLNGEYVSENESSIVAYDIAFVRGYVVFDFAVNSLSSIDIDGYENRCRYRNELIRILKQGGLSLFRTVSVNNELEKLLMKKYPGEEINSSIWPESKKFQKNYSYEEIREFYKDFRILELTEYVKSAKKCLKRLKQRTLG